MLELMACRRADRELLPSITARLATEAFNNRGGV